MTLNAGQTTTFAAQVCANRDGKRDGCRDHYEQCIESDFDCGAGWSGDAATSQREPSGSELRQPGGRQQFVNIRHSYEYGQRQCSDLIGLSVWSRVQHYRAFSGDVERRSEHVVQREIFTDSSGSSDR